MTERELRRRQVLDADDRLIEWKQGTLTHWSVAGVAQPLPGELRTIVCYSDRRLFLGSSGRVVDDLADLGRVWHAGAVGQTVRLVFTSNQLTTVRWQPGDKEDDAALAGFAARIMAQRDRRLPELPAGQRQWAANQLAELQRSGVLEAALDAVEAPKAGGAKRARSPAGPATSPETYIGRWIRALLLKADDERRELADRLNGGQPGWNDDEPAVLQAVCELALRRCFGERPDLGLVTKFVSEMRRKIAQGKETPPAQDSTEAVIRVALGGEAAEISALKRVELINIRGVVTVAISGWLTLREPQINEMIVAGEDVARARGWAPPMYRG